MKWIKLTGMDGRPITINAEKIISFYTEGKGVAIQLEGSGKNGPLNYHINTTCGALKIKLDSL